MATLDELANALDDAWIALSHAQEKRAKIYRSWKRLTNMKSPQAAQRWQDFVAANKAENAARKAYDTAREAFSNAGGN